MKSWLKITQLVEKIGEIEYKIPNNSKYITSQEFNKLTTENVAARLNKLI